MHSDPLPGRRFGLTADTHDVQVDWPAVAAALADAWGPVDAILHCGDLTSERAIETLGAQAPVFATRSSGDPPEQPPLLTDGPRLFVADGLRIGMIFTLGKGGPSEAACANVFGEPIDVCVYGSSHEPNVQQIGEVLFVNPGSPSLAKRRTAAVLSLEGGRAAATIVDIDGG